MEVQKIESNELLSFFIPSCKKNKNQFGLWNAGSLPRTRQPLPSNTLSSSSSRRARWKERATRAEWGNSFEPERFALEGTPVAGRRLNSPPRSPGTY